MENSPYELQLSKPDDLERNFYEALSVKDNNTEVIWAHDRIYPGSGQQTNFTTANIPGSHAEDIDRAYAGPILNLVEAYEYINKRNGDIKIQDNNEDYIFYRSDENTSELKSLMRNSYDVFWLKKKIVI